MRCQAYRNVAQDGQEDVDEEVGIASALEEDAQRRNEDGEDDLDDVAVELSVTRTMLRVDSVRTKTDLAVKGMAAVL